METNQSVTFVKILIRMNVRIYSYQQNYTNEYQDIQSGRCSPAKHGDAYFSAICGSIQDPIAAPGLYENQEC